MNFDDSFTRLLGHEGQFVDDPRDKGGATCWGVTEAVARVNGYAGAMRDLPQDAAKEIYRARYWDSVRADELPDSVRVFPTGVGMNRGGSTRKRLTCCVPHGRGDEPRQYASCCVVTTCSPRAWG